MGFLAASAIVLDLRLMETSGLVEEIRTEVGRELKRIVEEGITASQKIRKQTDEACLDLLFESRVWLLETIRRKEGQAGQSEFE